eukprot:2759957-Alexandrium_andersonii.AAC.1
MAESLKHGGEEQHRIVFGIAKKMWKAAASARVGEEARERPPGWKVDITVPMWKRKGKKADRNTWRGITLPSVGSKLVARVVAARLQR